MADFYEIAQCEHCDDTGIRLNGMGRCDHIDYAAAAKRGMALIRAALRKEQTN
jgi:hypothetical protein